MIYMCIGAPITDLRAEQISLTTVLVIWTAPSTAPSREYVVTVVSAGIIETTTGTSHNVTRPQPAWCAHYPSPVPLSALS